jgi:hypothetical protein
MLVSSKTSISMHKIDGASEGASILVLTRAPYGHILFSFGIGRTEFKIPVGWGMGKLGTNECSSPKFTK